METERYKDRLEALRKETSFDDSPSAIAHRLESALYCVLGIVDALEDTIALQEERIEFLEARLPAPE